MIGGPVALEQHVCGSFQHWKAQAVVVNIDQPSTAIQGIDLICGVNCLANGH